MIVSGGTWLFQLWCDRTMAASALEDEGLAG